MGFNDRCWFCIGGLSPVAPALSEGMLHMRSVCGLCLGLMESLQSVSNPCLGDHQHQACPRTHLSVVLVIQVPIRNSKQSNRPNRRRVKPPPRPRRRNVPRRTLQQDFQLMTMRTPMTTHCPLPMRMRTKFVASGYFSVAAASTQINMHFKFNSCILPFTNTNSSGAITWNNLALGTFNPAGFSTLCNTVTLYAEFIFESVLFEFDFLPQSVVDSVVVTGTPSGSAGIPSSVGAAMTRPWTKQQCFASGRTYRQGDYPFKHRLSPSTFLGIPHNLYVNDVSGNFVGGGSSDPPALLPYTLNIATGDLAGLNNPLEARVRITYFVLLRSLSTDTLATN